MDLTRSHHHNSRQNLHHHACRELKKVMPARRRDKMTFLSKKYEEIVLLDAMQNFSNTMLPFFNTENYPFLGDFCSSIMGDSPTAVHRENAFNYDTPGRLTPPPTTSFLAAKHDGQINPQPQDSTVIEPAKEEQKELLKDTKDKEKDDMDFNSPDANPGYKPESEKRPDGKKGDSKDGGGGGDKGDGEKKKLNGDVLDGKWVQPVDDKKPEDDKEDSCVVNCLYYTLQCCECTIT